MILICLIIDVQFDHSIKVLSPRLHHCKVTLTFIIHMSFVLWYFETEYPVSLQIFHLFMFVYISIHLRFPIFFQMGCSFYYHYFILKLLRFC